MKETLSIETERTDDIPLLVTQMQHMQLASLLDKHFPTHGLRKGLSMGELILVWLTHVLSQADHRMNRVQEWVSRRLTTLRGCGLADLTPLDVTDDRLADVLRLLSDDEQYRAFEQELMGHLLRVYDLEARCVRLDTTTVSSYADVSEEGLLQLGHRKDHRPDLPQVKIALATLDPFGVPLASEVLSGEKADDPVYVPLIDRVHQGLGRAGLLYVGDCKMAAEKTRAHIQAQGDFYLCPLSALHVPPAALAQNVEAYLEAGSPLMQAVREDEAGQPKCLAQGYETLVEMEVEDGDQTICWPERRLMIQSIDGSLAAQSSLQARLEKAEQAIRELMVRKQGKPRLTSRLQVEEQVQSILSSLRVEGLLHVHIQEAVQVQPVRAYRGKPSSPRQTWSFQIQTERNPQAIERAMKRLGWRVSATNQHSAVLELAQAVEAYRDESLVERNFGRLKGHPLSLGPLYVQRDDHRVGLIRLLTIALRVVTVLEG
ncbi:MAG TPA: IS1634 family transposase, partial [Aggregatilineales bacterium]|nr:IS1634 family transposase [Aggregatilineales bacterium]